VIHKSASYQTSYQSFRVPWPGWSRFTYLHYWWVCTYTLRTPGLWATFCW